MDTEAKNLEPEFDTNKPVMLFGRDIRTIPCFKHSMLYGIYSGLAAGLVTFMATSRPMLATRMAVGSWMSVATVHMIWCRYTYTVQKYEMNNIRMHFQSVDKITTEDKQPTSSA
ncbi:cytochrome c oxidase protein 20 homolog [Pseudomyrmex gracilis]|uniref:cytochrome c oxidase protein 20 homolog n=1 Tax=Pseudomyrmex gracilis TaxID=219809 RepID=UPI0009954563|nr:cytochrome c oxidase protein 20 homolog [Pseudomyrmex gracilis]XP_020282966.1 cytochrome c oxidase protein 20 homolog [Pseudomyrmex gracilis]